MSIEIPQNALAGLEHVRKSDKTNMFDFATVQRFAHENEFHATVSWMETHRERYLEGIVTGFEATDR